MRILWSVTSARDLNGIYEYYARINQRAAANMYNNILDEVDKLSVNPYVAAIEQSLHNLPRIYRSLVVSNYKVIYYVENDTVHISRVWDCRRNPERIKKSLEEIL
jgi:plasmid stabilization system protein ParE